MSSPAARALTHVRGPGARVLGPHLVKYLGHILVLRGRLRETR